MNKNDIIREIADILEVSNEEVVLDKPLDEYEAWDSVAVLSVISLVNDQTGRFLHASDILKLNTVQDLVNLLV